MKKFFTNMLALLAVIMVTSFAAKADNPFPTDGSPITLGEVYDVKAFVDYDATFTAPTTGTLIQNGCPDLKIEGLAYTHVGYGDFGQIYSWQVEAGKTYHIYTPTFIIMDGQVSFTMENDLGIQLTRALPGEGDVLSPIANLTGDILLNFNTSVIIDGAGLYVGDVMVELVNSSLLPNVVALNVRDAMNSLFYNGTLARDGGEEVTVKVHGLQTTSGELYNGDGELTINYISSPQLTDLVSTNIPKVLKSYYPEGDPEGIWTFVFDRNIVNDGSVYLEISCGNPISEGMFYIENIKPKIDGATLTFDLTGKLRELDDYTQFQDVKGYVSVKLCNVYDTDGNMALGSGGGNVGSYDYSLAYNYLPPETIVCEFDPPTGSSLQGVKEIEIWFNNAGLITFDGVEFNYHTESGFESVVVLNSELNITTENNEKTILCPVPDAVQGHDQITVKLYNQQSKDGFDYHIVGMYDMFIVDLLSPIKPGQHIERTGTEDFVFNINLATDFFYIRYDFYNGDGETGWAYGTQLHKQNNGTYTAYNNDVPCYKNFNPYMIVSAYYNENDYNYGEPAAETFRFDFVGTAAPFAYSDVKFVSIDPEPDTVIVPSDDFCFTIVYDGLVHIDAETSGVIMGMGMGVVPFEKIEPIYGEDEYLEGYAPVWCLYPDFSAIEGYTSIDISIFAKDDSGKVVEGNLGAGEFDCLQFSYPLYSESNFYDLDVTPQNFSTVGQLSEFIFSYDGKDVGINYSYEDDVPVRIIDIDWNILAEFTKDDFESIENADGTFSLKLTFAPITVEGEYTLFVPENFMLIGDQFDVHGNAAFWGSYTVDSAYEGVTSLINSNDGSVVIYNLQGMRVDGSNLRPGFYIINGQKVYIRK